MCKIVRNCTILLQNTTLNLTLTHALSITLTLNPDPNFNPNPIAILHLYSAFRNPHFTVPVGLCDLTLKELTLSSSMYCDDVRGSQHVVQSSVTLHYITIENYL